MSLIRDRALKSVLLSLLISLCVGIAPSPISLPANAADVDTSTEGFQFDISLAPSRSNGTNWNIYISSNETGTAVVDWPTSANTNLNLSANGIQAVNVAAVDRVASGASGPQSKNIKITSTTAISVYACWIESAASDCTNFYPTPTWGTRYRVMYTPASVGTQIISIVTSSSPATVTLRPKISSSATPNTVSLVANTPTNIEIDPNSSYMLTTAAGDFGGMEITSNTPISVLNGAECVNFNSLFSVTGACDLASQSVPPVSSWGTNFYSVNYRNFGASGSGYRILADQNNTTVTVSGDISSTTPLTTIGVGNSGTTTGSGSATSGPVTKTLQAGEIWTFKAFGAAGDPHKSIAITSNNPILVGHYMFNGGVNDAYRGAAGTTDTNGDPSMSYVTPFEQFLTSYNFASPTGLAIANINIVTPASAVGSIKLDGVTVSPSEFRTIAGSSWKSAQIVVATGTHSLTSPQALGLEAYGAGSADSYAYTGGANTSSISSVATLRLNVANRNGVVGQQICIPVEVLDSYNSPVVGVRVDASASGASGSVSTNATANSNGVANVCYSGTTTGSDTVLFTANGFTASANVTWTLTAPAVTVDPSTVQLATSVAMRSLTPKNSGGLATTWGVSPSLPSGLSLNTSTGVITGTPTADFAATQFSVFATNSAGTDTATVTISSAPVQIASIAYSPSTISLTLDSSTVLTPTVSGTFPTWSVSPTLPAGLSINAQNGVITGTPSRVASSATYTITATNSAGAATTTINLAVAATPPDITYDPSSYVWYKDVAISSISPRNAGSLATSWSVSPALPSGVALNTTNGSVTGTPSAASSSANYVITATNSGGSDTFTVTIEVRASVPAPVISYSPTTISAILNTPITSVTPTNSGGTATGWTISPSLPAGLSFNTATGRISGTATAVAAAADYTVTATNSGGSSTAVLRISADNLTVPTISYSPSTINAILAKSLGNKTPTVTGGQISGYTISKPLPAGLNFNTTTGVISGTPTAIAASDTYTVTVTNSQGSGTTVIRVKVYDTISLGDETTNSYQTGKAATSTVNTALGTVSKMIIIGYPDSETVRLVLSTDKGTIKFNTTTGLTAATGFQNPIGAAAASIGFIGTVAAMNSALETLSFIASSNVETATVTADLSYIGTGGAKAYYTPNEHYYEFVSTAVTWNAAYDATVGCQKTYNGLCGYLATVTSSQENDFIVSKVGTAAAWLGGADNGGRANDTSLFGGWAEGTWRWVDGPSSEKGVQFSNGSTSVSSRYVNWNTSEPNNVGVGGEHVLQILSGGTGKWNDLPQNSSLMGYVIEYGGFETETVTYPGVTRILTIGIADIPPVFSYSPSTRSVMRNVAMTAISPTSTGGLATSWTIAPSLPAGLSFNTSTGVISGTPTAQTASTTYQVVATNAQGSDTRTITIEVVIPPSISYSPSSLSATTGSAISALTPTNTGGPVSSWSVSPALPAGLTLNTTTGVISGTPTTVQAATNYTITATNLGQTSTFVLSITVNAPAPAGGGGANAPAKVTALYFKIVDPNDETKAYTKKVCISVYSRDLSPRFLASGCSDDQGNVNLLAGDAKVTVKVYESGYGDKTRDYNGTIGSDTFDLDGSKYFPGTTRWVVTFPKAAAPTPTPSPTPTPTPSPTVTPSPSPTKAPDLGPVTSADSLKPGVVSVLINGKVVTVTVTPNDLRDGLVIKGDGWTINVSTLDPNGKARPLTAQGYLDAVVEGRIKVTGTGFAPNSEYRIYLFANLIQLETAKTNDAGGFTTTLQLPDSIKAGNQVLQVNALGSNNEVRSISIGLVISAKPAPSATAKPSPTPTKASSSSSLNQVVSFDFAKFKVGSKQVATLKKLNLTGKNVRVSLTGYAQKSGTRDDLRISLDRALEVKKAILKINPKAKVTVLGGGTKPVAQCKAFANRCVIAKVVKG